MKHRIFVLPIVCICLCWQLLSAQQVPTIEIWPLPGDSMNSLVDNLPLNIGVGRPGPDRVWDFTTLQAPFVRTYTYSSAGDEKVKLDKGSTSYIYSKRNNALFLTGILKADPLRMGADVNFKCSPALLEYKNPIQYQDASSEYSRFIGYMNWSQVPSQYVFPDVSPEDSLRISIEVFRDDAVDSWGTMLMQNESYEVLRIRRVEEQLLKIQAKIAGEWTDVTATFKTMLRGIAWSSTTYSYLFVANGISGPIAEVYTDEEDNVEKVIYGGDPKMAQKIDPTSFLKGAYVYPNPTFGRTRFEFFNLPEGNYELSVYNILGKKLWSKEETLTEGKVIQADLTYLDRGTYFYSLKNEKGKRITTRRLIIIEP